MGAFDDIPVEDIDGSIVEIESGVCEVYYAPISTVTGTPNLTAISSSATVKALGEFDGDVTFVSGKGWNKIKTLVDTSEPKNEGVGPKGQRRIKSVFEFMTDGDNATVLGTQRLLEGVPMIYLVKHRGGDHLMIGSKCNPAYATSSNFTAGKTEGDTTGCTFSVEAQTKLGVFKGTLPS